MNKLAASTLAVLAATALTGGGAEAQISRVSLEPRAGASFPIEGEGLNTGYVVGADVIFQATPILGIYGGYNFNSYEVDGANFGEDVPVDFDARVEVQGFAGGVRATFPAGRFSPYFKGGLLLQSLGINISSDEGSFSGSGDRELGFQIGGGVEVPVTPRFSVTPGVSYNKVEDVEYVRADVGLRIRL